MKRKLGRATRAAVAAAAERAEQGGQLRIGSDQIAFRVSHLSSRTLFTLARFDPSTPATTTSLPLHLPPPHQLLPLQCLPPHSLRL
jgi:hypothetical protein